MSRYLIDHDPTAEDMKEAKRGKDIYDSEANRVAMVLAHFVEEGLVSIKPKARLRALQGSKGAIKSAAA